MPMRAEAVEQVGGNSVGRAVVEDLLAAVDRGDMAAPSRLTTDDFVMEWPQSGERFVGRTNALAAWEAQDEKPEFAGEPRIVGDGDVWVAMLPLRYGTQIHHYVGVFELRDGRICQATEFFATPFEGKETRAAFTDRR